MNKENLRIARNVILEALEKAEFVNDKDNMAERDRIELCINIPRFLHEDDYQENIVILEKNRKRK